MLYAAHLGTMLSEWVLRKVGHMQSEIARGKGGVRSICQEQTTIYYVSRVLRIIYKLKPAN